MDGCSGCGSDEGGGHVFDFFAGEGGDVEFAGCGSNVGVVVYESEHAGFGVVFQLCGDFGKGFFVESGVVFFVGEYGVVAPDYFFFSYFFR